MPRNDNPTSPLIRKTTEGPFPVTFPKSDWQRAFNYWINRGLEQTPFLPEKTGFDKNSAALFTAQDALAPEILTALSDPKLQKIVEAWPGLSPAIRRKLLAIVEAQEVTT